MSKPITTWRAAAQILGMCEDTLCKRRKQFRDRTPTPWWESEQAVRDWYKALIAPPPEPVRAAPAAKAKRAPAPTFDERAGLDELLSGA